MDHSYIFRPLSNNKYILQSENNKEITLSSGDSLLIDLMQGYPHLYDKSSSNYKDSIMKENSWNEIGKIMMCPANECKNRWTRLRERFSKERREIEAEYKSGSGVSHRKGFALYENMKFLNNHVQQRRTLTNIPQNKKNKENVPLTTSTLPNLMKNFEDNSFSKERRESETEYKSGIGVSYRKGSLSSHKFVYTLTCTCSYFTDCNL